jgi:hypothetical protein
MRFVIEQQAGPGNRFAPDAFASQIGKQIPVEVRPGERVQGAIRSADVSTDGTSARIQVEIPDDAWTPPFRAPLESVSISWTQDCGDVHREWAKSVVLDVVRERLAEANGGDDD